MAEESRFVPPVAYGAPLSNPGAVRMGYPAGAVRMGYPAGAVRMGYPAGALRMGYPAASPGVAGH